jgi:hypothetical protein
MHGARITSCLYFVEYTVDVFDGCETLTLPIQLEKL